MRTWRKRSHIVDCNDGGVGNNRGRRRGAKQVSRFVDELDLSLMSTRNARVSAECPAVTCRVRARQWHECLKKVGDWPQWRTMAIAVLILVRCYGSVLGCLPEMGGQVVKRVTRKYSRSSLR